MIAHDGRQIAVYHWPARQPNPSHLPVFCVHALTRNGRDFDAIASVLSQDREVYSLDVVGRGQSDWLPAGQTYDYELYLKDITAVVEALSLTRLHWIGTSMGGIIGIAMAALQPQLIQALVVNDIGAEISLATMQRLHEYVGLSMQHPNREAAMEYVQKCYGAFGLTQPWQWEHLFHHSYRREPDGSYTLRYDPHILNAARDEAGNFTLTEGVDLWPYWNEIHRPILLLRGAESEFLSPEMAQRMVAAKPQTSLLEIPHCGHAPSLMEPEQITAVKDWLN